MGDNPAASARERDFNEVARDKEQHDSRLELLQLTYTMPGQDQAPSYSNNVAPAALKAIQDAKDNPPTGTGRRYSQNVAPAALDATAPRQDAGGRLPPGGAVVPPAVKPLDGGPPIQPGTGKGTYNPTQPPVNFPGLKPGEQPAAPGANPGGGLDPNEAWRRAQEAKGVKFPAPGQVGAIGPRTGGGEGEWVPTISPERKKFLDDSLILKHNVTLSLAEGALGGWLGSGPIPWTMDKMMTRKTVGGRMLMGAGLGAGLGFGLASIGDKDHVTRDTAVGGVLGAALGSPVGMGYWRQYHSPLQLQIDAKIAEATHHRIELRDVKAEESAAAAKMKEIDQRLAAGREDISKWIGETEKKFDSLTDKTTVEAKLVERRLGTLDEARRNPLTYGPESLSSVRLPSEKLNFTEGKFLTPQEVETLSKRYEEAVAREGKAKIVEAAPNKIKELEARIEMTAGQVKLLNEGRSAMTFWGAKDASWHPAVKEEAGAAAMVGNWRGNKMWNRLGEGVFLASVGIAADYVGDLAMGHNQRTLERPKLWLEGPATAAAMCMGNRSMGARVGLIVGAVALEHTLAPKIFEMAGLDQKSQADVGAYFQPNWIDSIGMSAAWMMPFRNEKVRLGAVALAYGTGRLADALSVNGIDVPGIQQVARWKDAYEGLRNLAENSKDKRDFDTFKQIVDKGTQLGLENDGALVDIYTQFQSKRPVNNLDKLINGSALRTAMGNLWMERGTLYDKDAHQDEGRFLARRNIDIGGEAAKLYQGAERDLMAAEAKAKASGIDPSEITRSREYVQERIKLIYGEHKISEIVQELKEGYGKHVDLTGKQKELSKGIADMAIKLAEQGAAQCKRLPNTQAEIDKLHPGQRMVVAKLLRDVVVLNVAIAAHKGEKRDGDGGEEVFIKACKFWNVAKMLDPNSADLELLKVELEKTGPVIASAIQKQWSNDINNPFGVSR